MVHQASGYPYDFAKWICSLFSEAMQPDIQPDNAKGHVKIRRGLK
jgi:hypothetical protein